MTISRFSGEHRFLSNFFPSPVEIGGVLYPTAEHLYQSLKAPDANGARYVAAAPTPADSKRRARNFPLPKGWDTTRDSYMLAAIAIKFTPASDLARKLIATYPHELIEGNTWGDHYWGVCRGRGENKLGQLLMVQRKLLINFYAKEL